MPDPFDAVHARLLELPLFFVGGMPRSGTTWMQQLLNAHPNVLCMGESRFFEDLIPNLYEMLKGYSRRRHDMVDTWGPGVSGLTGMHMGPIFKASFASLAGANLGDKDVADLVTVGEKTPDNITSLRRLWQIYPEARVIHVIRDPRDGAVSGYIRFNKKLVGHISREDYIPSYCEQWRNRILEARKVFREELPEERRPALEFFSVDRFNLAEEFGILSREIGDVGRKFHDLVRLSVAIRHRIIGGLDPDFLAAISDAAEFAGLKLASAQRIPEIRIGFAVALLFFDEHAVMLAAHFIKRVTQSVEKVIVGGDDRAIEVKFDDSLGTVERIELGFELLKVGGGQAHLKVLRFG